MHKTWNDISKKEKEKEVETQEWHLNTECRTQQHRRHVCTQNARTWQQKNRILILIGQHKHQRLHLHTQNAGTRLKNNHILILMNIVFTHFREARNPFQHPSVPVYQSSKTLAINIDVQLWRKSSPQLPCSVLRQVERLKHMTSLESMTSYNLCNINTLLESWNKKEMSTIKKKTWGSCVCWDTRQQVLD